MFEKNDKPLLFLRKFVDVCLWILIGCCVVGAIVFFAATPWIWYVGLIMLLCGPLFCLFCWVLIRLRLNYYCDIKLIRNKLYKEENTALEAFLRKKEKPWAAGYYPPQGQTYPPQGYTPQTPFYPPQTVQGGAAQGQSLPQQVHPLPPQDQAHPAVIEVQEAALLERYKQLLDSGVLTQEEFDKLKAETLKKQ